MPKEKISKWQKFKRFLKRNMTPTWAKHFSYQVFSFIVSVAMIVGVVNYAFQKSYDERTLHFVDGFTITAHSGAYNTSENTLQFINTALENNASTIELDVRQRPNGTIVMCNELIATNNDGVELSSAFQVVKEYDNVTLNLDIKENKLLADLYNLIIEYGVIDRVILTGIEIGDVEKVNQNCPGVSYYLNYIPSRYQIYSEDYQNKILALLEKTKAIGINCNYAYASGTLSDLLHNNGYKLSVYTVDKKRQMKRALVIEPDNITTHYPNQLQDLIDNWGK